MPQGESSNSHHVVDNSLTNAHIDVHENVRFVQSLPIPVPFPYEIARRETTECRKGVYCFELTWSRLRFHIGRSQHKEPAEAESKQGPTEKDNFRCRLAPAIRVGGRGTPYRKLS